MPYSGMIFDNQVPTAKGFRALFAACLSDGVIDGCKLTYSTSGTLTIGAGFYHCAGGEVYIPEGSTVSVTKASTGYTRVKAVINTTATSTTEEFSQFSLVAETSVASLDKLGALTQNNINTIEGTTYEAEFCIIDMANSSIYRQNIAYPKVLYGPSLPDTIPSAGTMFVVTEE